MKKLFAIALLFSFNVCAAVGDVYLVTQELEISVMNPNGVANEVRQFSYGDDAIISNNVLVKEVATTQEFTLLQTISLKNHKDFNSPIGTLFILSNDELLKLTESNNYVVLEKQNLKSNLTNKNRELFSIETSKDEMIEFLKNTANK